ncbi:MAG: preprotein translocase subunit SecE [Clostridia bacterium]|nr:preprotein translocase subunit SecE [Clostridia bacterium]
MAEKNTAAEAIVEKKDKKPAAKKPGVFKRIWAFIKGMRSELKKVTWPSFRQVVNNTLVVIVVVVGSGVFIGLVDLLFKTLMGLLV